MKTQLTISQQIAGALGDSCGSYELLISNHICEAVGIEPTRRGSLVSTPDINSEAEAWLRRIAQGSGPGAGHAAAILAALKR